MVEDNEGPGFAHEEHCFEFRRQSKACCGST